MNGIAGVNTSNLMKRMGAVLAIALLICGQTVTPVDARPGDGGSQSASLGRAVVGGLALATVATLLVLPPVFALLTSRRVRSPSLDPHDPASEHHVRSASSH